jgi:hypothetical protein
VRNGSTDTIDETSFAFFRTLGAFSRSRMSATLRENDVDEDAETAAEEEADVRLGDDMEADEVNEDGMTGESVEIVGEFICRRVDSMNFSGPVCFLAFSFSFSFSATFFCAVTSRSSEPMMRRISSAVTK